MTILKEMTLNTLIYHQNIYFKDNKKITKDFVALITALDGTDPISKKLRMNNHKFINPLK